MRSLGLIGCMIGMGWASLGCDRQVTHFEADPVLAEAVRREDRGNGWFTRVVPEPIRKAKRSLLEAGLGGVVEVDVAGRQAVAASDDRKIADTEPVIGVTLGGKPRAYLLSSFEVHAPTVPEDLAGHVLLDETGSEPLCVTYCDRTRTARVLRSARGAEAMPEIRVGGWDGGLTLLVKGERHHQNDQELPLDDVAFEIVSWGEWREQHPQTELIRHAADLGH